MYGTGTTTISKPEDVSPQLLNRATAGDRDALSALAGEVQGRVYAFISRTLTNEDGAQDLTQDTLVAVLRSLSTLRDRDQFWPWVFSIAANTLRQHFRCEARRRALFHAVVEKGYQPRESWPADEGLTALSREELGEYTRKAMLDLREHYRMVLTMRFFDDMPHADIARVLGCSELSARAMLFRAKHALVRALVAEPPGRNLLGRRPDCSRRFGRPRKQPAARDSRSQPDAANPHRESNVADHRFAAA